MTPGYKTHRKPKGRWEPCGCCVNGLVSDYGYFGEDFYGPKECDHCGGGGRVWVYPSGHMAWYPGGPFCG